MFQMWSKSAHSVFGYRPILERITPCITSSITSRNFHLSPVATHKLPALPVPSLVKTLDKYYESVKPLLNEDELVKTCKIIKKFGEKGGIGSKLQKMLQDKAKQTENWLAEWWLHSAYLDFRLPVVVHSSPGLVFPLQKFESECDQLIYTAKMILGAVDYKIQIDRNKIPLDVMGKDPLDMNQYKKIFGTCRIPGVKRDSLQFNRCPTHIVVVCNNHFFKLNIWNEDCELLDNKQLVSQLEYIIKCSCSPTSPVGVLTSEHRDRWGLTYKKLMEDCTNQQSVTAIQKSLFLVCLDKCMSNMPCGNQQTIAGAQLIHGCGSKGNAGNRWFDKTVQFVTSPDGIVGLTYEHSPSEGQPIAVMTDYIVNYIKNFDKIKLPPASKVTCPKELCFNINNETKEAIAIASKNLDKLVKNLDLDCGTFDNFGKELIKSQKQSPDSFIQMAMQFAFYRIHKEPAAHYESAATRKYIHGRTETIRSCSVESVTFVKAMLDKCASPHIKAEALKAAIKAHKKYTIEAVHGYGVDRHLLGLKLICLENNIKLPEIFKDKAFIKSTHMRISSSQVATKCNGFMCYGPVVEDGYACCYNPRADDINIAITAFNSDSETCATTFKKALEQSLCDMCDVLVKSQKAKL